VLDEEVAEVHLAALVDLRRVWYVFVGWLGESLGGLSVWFKSSLRGCRLTVKVQELGMGIPAGALRVMVAVEMLEMSEMLEMLDGRG